MTARSVSIGIVLVVVGLVLVQTSRQPHEFETWRLRDYKGLATGIALAAVGGVACAVAVVALACGSPL